MSDDCIPMGERLVQLAAEYGDDVAVRCVWDIGQVREISWRELDRRSDVVAARLHRAAVADDPATVLLMTRDAVDHATGAFGAWKIGLTVLPLSPKVGSVEGEHVLAGVGRTITIGERVDWAATEHIDLDDIDAADAADRPSVEGVVADPMLLFASSGSTGIPKIINPFGRGCFKPGQFLGGLGKVVRRDSRRKTFTCTPLNHGAGSAGMYLGLFDGSEMTSIARFDPDVALWAIKQFGVHSVGLVPTMMARMMRSSRFDAEHVASLQTVSHTGGICSPSVKRAWIELVGPERIVEIYGSAESVGHTVITGTEWLEHPGSQGKPVNCELSILDEDGAPVPTGTVGEVFVKPLASEVDLDQKYVSDTLRMRQRGDLVSVGDLGYVDEEGYLYVVGRADDLIITGGVNVYPDEVEDVLRAVPGVADCVVVPVPDDERGQSVHAVVAFTPGTELSAGVVLDAMRSRISSYKLPRTVEIVPEIDRSEAGKVRRKKYAAAAGARTAAAGPPPSTTPSPP